MSEQQEAGIRLVYPRRDVASQPLVVSVGSGKGGVGKTLTTICFATLCSQRGMKTAILDGDMGMSNVEVVLNMSCPHSINDVLYEKKNLNDIMVEGPFGVKVVSSGSGLFQLQNLSPNTSAFLAHQLTDWASQFDVVFIDTPAGIGANVAHLHSLADRRVIITTTEPHALTDAYALMKVLSQRKGIRDFDVIVNMTASDSEGVKVVQRLNATLHNFLGFRANSLGSIPADRMISDAVLTRDLSEFFQWRSPSGQAWKERLYGFFSRRGRGLGPGSDLTKLVG